MAAVSIPPSPQVLPTMTSRRVPLANNPNAANSPFRAVTAAATKRQRAYAADQRDSAYGQPPPAKKQIIEVEEPEFRRNVPRRAAHNPTPLQRKLEAVRDAKAVQQRNKEAKSHEDVKLWREHYKKIFPSFVFYFEGLPEDVRRAINKQVRLLGSREEKFFSKSVTHVVTTRAIPKDRGSSTAVTAVEARATTTGDSNEQFTSVKTINPSLLDRPSDARTNLFDAALLKKATIFGQQFNTDVDVRKFQSGQGDVLLKAKDMGMKIWALEKLERMLDTLFADDEDDHVAYHARVSRATAAPLRNAARDADLSQLLKKEKLTGPADRDLTVATQEMVPLRGCYVYVYDLAEKTRPVMVRDYTVPATKEEGKWPQFRNTGCGKCPFVEDPNHSRKQQLREAQRNQGRPDASQNGVPRTRAAAAAALDAARHTGPAALQEKIALTERNNNLPLRTLNLDSKTDSSFSKPLEPPKMIPAKRSNPDDLPPMFTSTQASRRPAPKFAGGEPIASGVQPSNITSAIRSQLVSSISSTAAVPGVPRAGTSKEMNQLKRKVLERTSAPSANSMGSSYANDVRAAINNDRTAPARAAKRKAQESLAGIKEDATQSEHDEAARRLANLQRKRSVERDPKPGYCENCREKFDDFEKHVETRKHKSFAKDKENWGDLDSLLRKLTRPLAAHA